MNSFEQSDQPSPESYSEAARVLLREFEISAQRERERRRAWAIGFLILVGAAVGLLVSTDIVGYHEGKSLRVLGERSFVFWMVAPLSFFLLSIAVIVVGLAGLIKGVMVDRRISWQHLLGIALVVTVFVFRPYDYNKGLWARLKPVDEPAYILLAQQTRSLMEGQKERTIIFSDYDPLPDFQNADKRNRAAFSRILKASTLADWPLQLTKVFVDDDSVWLKRGSGMMGEIGIRIFDKLPEAKLRPMNAARENPYIHEEYPLSARVVFTTND